MTSWRSSARVVVPLVLLALASLAPTFRTWWVLDETRSFTDSSSRPVQTRIVTLDPRRSSIRIVSVPFESGSKPGLSELSLRDFVRTLTEKERYRRHDWIALNGGYSSYRVDVPVGLLAVDGKVYSSLSRELQRTRGVSSSSGAARLRWSGVLCQTTEGREWKIIAASEYAPGACWQALQAGPVLVEPDFKLGITPGEPASLRRYRRTVVCLTREGSMRWIVTLDETHLLPLAEWLRKPEAEGGVGCRVALNLSGDSSTGLAVHSRGADETLFFGEGSFPLPSALVAEGNP